MNVYRDIVVETTGPVTTVELRRPPNNFFDPALIAEVVTAFEACDANSECRAIVLASQGKAFCAGADFSAGNDSRPAPDGSVVTENLYKHALRLFRVRKPVVAAVHGAAVGGGLGLAMVADFRVTCEEARFSANFTRLGFHPGFGLTVTLPRVVGAQKAALLFYTGRRINGAEAHAIGLADVLVEQAQVRAAAEALAREIAESSPLGVMATRETLRRGLVDAIEAATEREFVEQEWLRRTADFGEGVKAMAERRLPNFRGM